MKMDTDVLARVEELYDRGLYLQALEAGKPLGEPRRWPGTQGRILAGRLGQNLGGARLGRVLYRLAWRADPASPMACYYHGTATLGRFGPLAAWKFLRKADPPAQPPTSIHANWFGLHAEVLATLRDFQRADEWLNRAEDLVPDEPFLWVQRAHVWEQEDRLDDALGAARRSMEIRPWFRPGVQMTASLLCQLNRHEEALALLTEASEKLESGLILWQLASLEIETEQYAEACEVLERIDRYLPLVEKDLVKQLAALHADAAYQHGDHATAARLAPLAEHAYFNNMAERLADMPAEGKRSILPVEAVRQHHQTCAPATLTALGRYWSKPVDHEEVVQEICYGGTSAQKERVWAEEHGFLAREFRVTIESTVALVDRGVPFALETQGTDWGHLQAIVGYDTRMGTFLVRDPSNLMRGECLAQGLLDACQSSGPRGMAIVPRERAHLLEGVELSDERLFDLSHRLRCALEDHDRDGARQLLNEMRALEPNHWLTIDARARLAHYDTDWATLLNCAERLLRKFPDTGRFLVSKLNCLNDLAGREDRLAFLKEICDGPASEPIFWQRYAGELADDAREHGVAASWLRRAIRARPSDGASYRMLADVRWAQRLREEALDLYRFAACLEETNEECAKAYFAASRHLKQTDVALSFLNDRFGRFAGRSSRPALTLCWAYDELDRIPEAFDVLDKAIALRPQDGDLRVQAADVRASYGDYETADRHLGQAREKTHPVRWLQSRAHLARCRGDLETAAGCWREVVEADPLYRYGHEMLAGLLADTQGRDAAVEHLEGVVRRFPHHVGLSTLLVEWLRDADPSRWEAAVRRILEIHPVDPWAHRELAFCLSFQNRLDEALDQAEGARRLDPTSPVAHVVLGDIHRGQGNAAEAKRAYRAAVELSVDHDPAIAGLLSLCNTKEERREELMFVHRELVRQVIFGEGLLTFRQYASETLEPTALVDILREALEARPDLWHAWSALVRQLTELDRGEEALDPARRAVDRFPLMPRLWLDLAAVCRACDDGEEEIRAIEKALEINPAWPEAGRALADAHQRAGDLDKAEGVLRRALVRQPAVAPNHGCLADVLWQLDQQDEALNQIQEAVRLDPGYQWAWDTLRDWSRQLERPELPIELARRLTQTRPYEARSWLVLADVLEDPDHREECFEALDRALALSPRSEWAYHMRAYYLAQDGRYDEALAACRPDVFGDDVPWGLCAQAAEIEAQRGNRDGAIAQMQAVCADNPDSARVWLRLAEWFDEGDENDRYLEAARQLTRLAPENQVSWNHLGDALRKTGDTAGAVVAFQQGIGIEPPHPFAIASLFDLYLETEDVARAAEVIPLAEEHLAAENVLEYRVRLAVAAGEQDVAVEHLRALAVSEGDALNPLDAAVHAMVQAGWYEAADRTLAEQMDSAGVNSAVGPVWVEYCFQNERWKGCHRRLAALGDGGEIWYRASQHYLYKLDQANRKGPFLRYVRSNGNRLERDVRTWQTVGQGLTRIGEHKRAVRWMAGWESRDDLDPETLFCLAVSLWELRREPEARRASARALQLPPDGTTAYHHVWLAVYAALDDEPQEAAAHLGQVEAASLTDWYQVVHGLAGALVELGEAAAPRGYFAARKRLRGSVASLWSTVTTDKGLQRLYQRCLRRLAKNRNRRLAAAWHGLRATLG